MTEYFRKTLCLIRNIIDYINKNDKFALMFVLIFTICYKLILVKSDVIFNDSAFYLSYSIDLDSAMTYLSMRTAPLYLTALVSNLFLKLFSAKLLGLRILQILNYLFLFYCVFKLFKRTIPNICIILGCILSIMVLSNPPLEFNYNDMSVSMCALSLLLMVKSMEKANLIYIFFSGVIFALCVFSRLPNVVYLVLTSYVLLFYNDSRVNITRYYIIGALGFLVGIVVVLLLILLRGDLYNVYDGFLGIVSLAKDSDNSHNTSTMFISALNQVYDVFILFFKNSLVFVFLNYFYKKKYNLLFVLVGCLFIAKNIHTFLFVKYSVPCLYIVWNTMMLLFVIVNSKECRKTAILLLVALYIVPLGSDVYFRGPMVYIFTSVVAPCAFYAIYIAKNTNIAFRLTMCLYALVVSFAIFVGDLFFDNQASFDDHTQNDIVYSCRECKVLKYVKLDSAKAAGYSFYIDSIKPLCERKTVLVSHFSDLLGAYIIEKNLYNNTPYPWNSKKHIYKTIISTYEKTKEKPDVLLRKGDMQDIDCPEVKFMKVVGGYSKKWENEKYTLFSPEN